MLSRLSRVLLIIALSLSIGAHWAALQSVAWATMIVEYSQHESFSEAVMQTFDGDHPCNLCKHIAAAEHSQNKKSDVQISSLKFDLICATRTILLRPRSASVVFAEWEPLAVARYYTPPFPPPRFELA